ncbi:MAG: pilus assembly PilX N-terminal domain-containing protein [Deltaproteobacteria bacterium]|nr:pilus assembly PilX N-terminal domain-containing protein [Deltaproteobacteria bacterium]MBW2089694.1 pilus assembly PilX N-terminal domain-containing protein [Deltaproteobacteria bacterium]
MRDNTPIQNEEGSVIVLSMVLLVFLTILGISATRTSSIEVQIASNERHAIQNQYKAESGNHYALEISKTWMTNNFLSTASNQAYMDSSVEPLLTVDIDNDGTADATIEIRCIRTPSADITCLTDGANNVPVQQHIGPPPPGSGCSLKDYEIRRYAITATSINGGNQIQLGAYKIFNKFN